MEKLLVRKTNKWKVKRVNFSSNYAIETQAEAVMKIQEQIDEHLKANFSTGYRQ
jgi:hypothetical protein